MAIKSITDIRGILFNNLNTGQTIFKNVFWLLLAKGSGILMIVLTIFAARILGVVEFGKFSFALSFVSLFVVFYSFGLPGIIIREFARGKGVKEDFYSIISLQILLTFVSFILILSCSFFITSDVVIRGIILVLSLFCVINGFITVFYSFFQSAQKMEYQAWFIALQYLLISGFGLCALLISPSVKNLSYVYFFSALVSFIAVLFFFNYKFFPLKIKLDYSVWKKFLTMSWPLVLALAFSTIYQFTDSVIMGFWNMMAETGWYNAAGKVVLVGLVPMVLISSSFYPALSKFSRGAEEKFQKIWNHYMEAMIILAIPIVVGGVVLASRIIDFAYGPSFNPSILAFQILISTAGITFVYVPFYDAMIALDQQVKIFWITLSGALINVALNLFLIPKYSLYGSAGATMVTSFLILLIIIIFIKRFTFLSIPVVKFSLTFMASLISVIFMYFTITQFLAINMFILVAIAIVVYFVLFLFIRKYILLKYFKQVYI